MQQTGTKRVLDKTWLGGKGDPQGTEQEIEIWLYYQMIYVQNRIHPGEWDTQYSQGFWDTTDHQISA